MKHLNRGIKFCMANCLCLSQAHTELGSNVQVFHAGHPYRTESLAASRRASSHAARLCMQLIEIATLAAESIDRS